MATAWSRKDEQVLNELMLRKQAFESEGRAAVEAVVEKMLSMHVELVEALIAHADEVRDALSRYDSGVRAAR